MCVWSKVLGFFYISFVIEFNGKKLSSSFCNLIKTVRFPSKFALKSWLFAKLPYISATTLPRFLQLWITDPSRTSTNSLSTKNVIPDTWQVTHDTWHVSPDMSHMRCKRWLGVNILYNFQLHSSFSLGVIMCWRFGGKVSLTHWLNEWVKNVFVEQPWLHRVC